MPGLNNQSWSPPQPLDEEMVWAKQPPIKEDKIARNSCLAGCFLGAVMGVVIVVVFVLFLQTLIEALRGSS